MHTLGELLEIRKQSAFEEAVDLEPQPEERTMTMIKLTEELDWLKLTSRCFRALIRRSSKQQLDRELGLRLLDMWRF
jgi:hypothetical protein